MKREELLTEIKKAGGTLETVIKHCQFQVFGQSFLQYCIQPTDSPYRLNLGSLGGPAVCCDGVSLLRGVTTRDAAGKEIVEPQYDKVEPCPFKVAEKVLGWRIMLPAGTEVTEVKNG